MIEITKLLGGREYKNLPGGKDLYSKNSLVLALEASVSLNLNAGNKLGSVSPTFASFIALFNQVVRQEC